MIRHRVLEQRRVVLQGGGQQRVSGNEGDDEFGRVVELLPVRLLRQRIHVGTQLPGVAHQMGLARRLVDGVGGVEKRLHGHLGIDDHPLGAGEVDHHVGTQPSFVAFGMHLLVEIAVLEHARHLHHPAELHLAPPTACGR